MKNPSEKPDPASKSMGVELVAREQPVQFAEAFREHGRFVWRCLRRLGVSDGDVDDVLQEVFLIVHRKLSSYDGRAPLRAWIYGIAVRKASDHRKLSHKRHERPMAELPERSGGQPEAALESRQKLAALDRALSELDDDKRAAFVLYEIEGLSLADLALATDAPLQTAYSRLVAARKHIEKALGMAPSEATSPSQPGGSA